MTLSAFVSRYGLTNLGDTQDISDWLIVDQLAENASLRKERDLYERIMTLKKI